MTRPAAPGPGRVATAPVRITVRVSPRSRQTFVGGRYGTAEPPVLLVRVTAPAVDGRANDAVVQALAGAMHVPAREVRITSGTRSRTKVLEVHGADRTHLTRLLRDTAEPAGEEVQPGRRRQDE